MSDYKVTDTQLGSIADAIRTKGGTSAQLEFPTGFVSAIAAIPSGGGDGRFNTVIAEYTLNLAYDITAELAEGE